MKRRLHGLVGLVVVLQFLFSVTPFLHAAQAIQTCSDFVYQEDAQKFFDSGGGRPQDWYGGMDQNNDGVACEHLPSKPLHMKTGFRVAVGSGVGLLAIGGILWWKRKSLSSGDQGSMQASRQRTESALQQPVAESPQASVHPQQPVVVNIHQNVDSSSRAEAVSRATATASSDSSSSDCPWVEGQTPFVRMNFEGYSLSDDIPIPVLQRMPYGAYLQTRWWKSVADEAKRAAGYKCQAPGCVARSRLDVHHLEYDRGNEKLEHLMVLCRPHHLEAHQNEQHTSNHSDAE